MSDPDPRPGPPPLPLSIRVLRRLNPLVAALLASPLHPVLSSDLLVLSYTGRKSGRRYSLPLSYVEQNGRIYLCSRPEGAGWWKNLRGGVAVDLRLRGRRVAAHSTMLEIGCPEALEGLRAFLTRNPGTGKLLYDVGTDAAGRPREGDLRREVFRSVVVRLDLEPAGR